MKILNNRDSASMTITKFDWQLGRNEPSSPSTKELHGYGRHGWLAARSKRLPLRHKAHVIGATSGLMPSNRNRWETMKEQCKWSKIVKDCYLCLCHLKLLLYIVSFGYVNWWFISTNPCVVFYNNILVSYPRGSIIQCWLTTNMYWSLTFFVLKEANMIKFHAFKASHPVCI